MRPRTEVWMQPNSCIHNPSPSLGCTAHQNTLPCPIPPILPPTPLPRTWLVQEWLTRGLVLHCSVDTSACIRSATQTCFTARFRQSSANRSSLCQSKEALDCAAQTFKDSTKEKLNDYRALIELTNTIVSLKVCAPNILWLGAFFLLLLTI